MLVLWLCNLAMAVALAVDHGGCAASAAVSQEFHVVPDLCTATELEKLFEVVNNCDEYVLLSPATPVQGCGVVVL